MTEINQEEKTSQRLTVLAFLCNFKSFLTAQY
jgi:hypothetical protein